MGQLVIILTLNLTAYTGAYAEQPALPSADSFMLHILHLLSGLISLV